MGQISLVSLGLLIVAISLSGVKSSCCPDGWLPMNGFCYKLNDQLKTWNDAETFCRKLKPDCYLASIHNMAESADLAEYVSDNLTKKDAVWIGLNYAQEKRVWEWTDRTCTNYLAWGPGEPNNKQKNEYCVELIPNTGYKFWNDHPCDVLRAFLCQCKS